MQQYNKIRNTRMCCSSYSKHKINLIEWSIFWMLCLRKCHHSHKQNPKAFLIWAEDTVTKKIKYCYPDNLKTSLIFTNKTVYIFVLCLCKMHLFTNEASTFVTEVSFYFHDKVVFHLCVQRNVSVTLSFQLCEVNKTVDYGESLPFYPSSC